MQILNTGPLAFFYTSSCIQCVLFLLLKQVEPISSAGCCNYPLSFQRQNDDSQENPSLGPADKARNRERRGVTANDVGAPASNDGAEKAATKQGGFGVDKATFMHEVGQLDVKYRQFLSQTILQTFRLNEAPERSEADDWRRRSDLGSLWQSGGVADAHDDPSTQQRPHDGAAGRLDDFGDSEDEEGEEPTLRKYTVNAVGKRTVAVNDNQAAGGGHRRTPSQLAKHRNHRHRNHRHESTPDFRPTVTKACIIDYHFNVALLAGQQADQPDVDTVVDKAEFVLPLRHRRQDDGYGRLTSQDYSKLQYDALHRADQFLFEGVDLLWSSEARKNTPDDVIDDQTSPVKGQQRRLRREVNQSPKKVVDVTFLFEPFWTVGRGANVTATSVVRYEETDSDESHNRRASFCEGIRPSAPILRLQLREVAKRLERTVKNKRHSEMKQGRRQTHTTPGEGPRDRAVNSMHSRHSSVVDCETQWDANFFKSMNDSLYDQLMPCCRRKIKLNFTELGWDSWVISPRSFDAYYCIGRCSSFGNGAATNLAAAPSTRPHVPLADDPHDLPSSTATHDARTRRKPLDGSALYAEMMNRRRLAGSGGVRGVLSLTPCCTPTKFASIAIRVLSGVNEQVTQVLDNLIVKRCGCM